MLRDRLGFRVLIDSDRGAHGDLVIVLERHGNRWLVSYLDKRLLPWACSSATDLPT